MRRAIGRHGIVIRYGRIGIDVGRRDLHALVGVCGKAR